MTKKLFFRRCSFFAFFAALLQLIALTPNFAFADEDKCTVHFGGSLPLTGPYAKVSEFYKDGYEFFMETIDHKLMVGGKICEAKLTLYDDENNPTKTAQLTEKLINVDKVDLLFSAYGTDPVAAQSSIAKKYNKILINAGSATRSVEEQYAGTTFTLVPTPDNYHRTIIQMMKELDPPIKTVAIITPDDPVYHEMANSVKEECKKLGIEVVFEDVIAMDTKDMGPTVLKMRGKEIDAVVNTGWDKLLAGFVNEAKKYNLKIKLIDGGHATMTPFLKEALGSKMQNIFGVTFWLPEAATKDAHWGSSQEFGAAFKEKYGYDSEYHVAMAYQILNLYEHILKDADPNDPFNTDSIRNELQKIDEDLLWGRVRFNELGRMIMDMLVIQWQGNPPQPVVVFPKSNAQASAIYPSNPIN